MSELKPSTEEANDATLKQEKVETIYSRLHPRLTAERVLPYASIQYILSEVGPGFQRLDPRELEMALRMLTAAATGTYLITERLARIYVAADPRGDQAAHRARVAAGTKQDQLHALANEIQDNRGAAAAEEYVLSWEVRVLSQQFTSTGVKRWVASPSGPPAEGGSPWTPQNIVSAFGSRVILAGSSLTTLTFGSTSSSA